MLAGAGPSAGTRPPGGWTPGAPRRGRSGSLHCRYRWCPPGSRNTRLKLVANTTESVYRRIQVLLVWLNALLNNCTRCWGETQRYPFIHLFFPLGCLPSPPPHPTWMPVCWKRRDCFSSSYALDQALMSYILFGYTHTHTKSSWYSCIHQFFWTVLAITPFLRQRLRKEKEPNCFLCLPF